MKLQTSAVRTPLFILAVMLAFGVLVGAVGAQEKPAANDKAASAAQFPAAKKQLSAAAAVDASKDSDKEKEGQFDKDSPEVILRREEWFYKQRAFPLGHIPGGARLRAFEHMQHMMEREGKLIRQPDGTYAAAAAALPVVGGTWSAIGPTPTTGGFFSPVTGRVSTIAVDPSVSTGDTVLLGGAQGGIWRTTDGGTNWTAVGDANPSLAMGSIAFAPSAPATVYAGTGEQVLAGDAYYGAGVLKSTDGGKTWNPTCPTPGPTCNNPFIGPFGTGFFPGGGARISYLAVNPTNPNLVLAGVQVFTGTNSAGVYCSNDGALNWTNILPGQMATFVGFASSSVAFAALGRPFGSASGGGQTNANGIYKSSNANSNCSAITFQNLTTLANSGLPTTNVGRIDMGIFDASTVYASIADSSTASATNQGIWKTTNGGATWTVTNAPDICQQQCWYDNVLKVDPNNSSIVFFGGSSAILGSGSSLTFTWVIHSTDGGSTWSPAIPTARDPGTPHVDQHAMAFFKATSGTFAGKVRMYLGNDGGAWRTDDAEAPTVTWTNINNPGLTLSQFYPSLSIHPSSPNTSFAGTQDNGSQNYQGPGTSWVQITCGDGGWTTIDPNVPSTVYVTCQLINIRRSFANGARGSFSSIVNGINLNDNVNFIPPITIDPTNPNRLYFGTTKVYQTLDGGDNWTAISPDLPGTGFVLTTVAVAPKSSSVVYAGSRDGGVFAATNVTPGNANFIQVGQGQLPVRAVTMVVPDPTDLAGNTAYVTFSGFAFGTDTKGHIFKTVNGGASFMDVSCSVPDCRNPGGSDLPNIPVNDLVVDPDVPGTLYAATDVGVFITANGGATWNTLGTGLPNVAVLSLRMHEPSRTLRAATHGRGAWDIVNNFSFSGTHLATINPTSTSAPGPAFTMTLTGSGFAAGTPQVLWDGAVNGITTTPGTDSQITANIPVSLLASGATHQVSVKVGATPASNSLPFTVLSQAPTISSVSPTSAPVNTSPNQQITVTGTNFGSNSKVVWNPLFSGSGGNVQLATTFNSPTQLTATIPASLMANFGSTNDIGVLNPPPGGGVTLPPPALPTFKVVAPAPPANDNFANAINITTTSFTDTKDSSGATTEGNDPTPLCAQIPGIPFVNGRSNTIWYKFTPGSNGTANLDTIGSSYDTVLSIWTGSAGSLTAVACNDDINPGIVIQSQLSNVSLTAGTTYFIMVSSFGALDPNPVAFGGKSVFNFTFAAAPDFTLTPQAPTSVTVTAGATANYTIAVAGNNGFSSNVNLSCTLPAAATTCTVTPNSVTPGTNANVKVTTTTHGMAPPAKFEKRFVRWPKTLPFVLMAMLALALLSQVTRSRRLRLAYMLPLPVLFLLVVFQAVGCGNSYSPPPPTGTQAGTYTVTVTGTSGSTTRTTTVTLVVY